MFFERSGVFPLDGRSGYQPDSRFLNCKSMLEVTLVIVLIGFGVGLVGTGLWVMRASAMPRQGAEPAQALPARGMSFASRAAVGLSLMFAGYHVAAWGTPEGWIALKVPRERWYLLVGGIVIAVGVSVGLDRMDREPGP